MATTADVAGSTQRPDERRADREAVMGVPGSATARRLDARAGRLKVLETGTRWPGPAASRPAVEIAHLRKTY